MRKQDNKHKLMVVGVVVVVDMDTDSNDAVVAVCMDTANSHRMSKDTAFLSETHTHSELPCGQKPIRSNKKLKKEFSHTHIATHTTTDNFH